MTQLDITPLITRIQRYNPKVDVTLLQDAYDFAKKAHRGQVRASGEPYFTHPLAVAQILADIRFDLDSIITALLHDVVEDTEISLKEISERFGGEIASLVDGVTKLTRIEMQSDNRQAENFRKFILATSEDIRVLFVKLADRVHNMRTLDYFASAEKRERIAKETLNIFAPLADRVGIANFQEELEDRGFMVLNPKMRETILSRLDEFSAESEQLVQQICATLSSDVEDIGLASPVKGRRKSPYSIWQKMQRQKVEMEELSDIMAFRLIMPTPEACYRCLGVLHQKYPMVMGRFKDYISTPKANGYQSLHTTIIGPQKKKIEVQIRTPEMHDIAINGVASHWSYKGRGEKVSDTDHKQLNWFKVLLHILENAESSMEFLEHTQMEMYADRVFCFSPKGQLISLPKGATAVDFAYAVHSGLGHTCVGVKINGKVRQLATQLNNGDQVEILNKADAMPSPQWENFVVTGRAKSAIRRFVRSEKQKEFCKLGRSLIKKAFIEAGETYDSRKLRRVWSHFKVASNDEIYIRVAENLLRPETILAALDPEMHANKKGQDKPEDHEPPVAIKGLIPGVAVHYGSCCHPLPGERIIGITTTGKGITVHRIDCFNLEKFSSTPELWVDIEWQHGAAGIVRAQLETVLLNQPGSLASIANMISEYGGNITNIQLTSRDLSFFTFLTDIEVKDVRHLTSIIAAMGANPLIESVKRAGS